MLHSFTMAIVKLYMFSSLAPPCEHPPANRPINNAKNT
jgi:hypothetical protein